MPGDPDWPRDVDREHSAGRHSGPRRRPHRAKVPRPKHCDSDELQGRDCLAPGECMNACAFWCGGLSACRSCCVAFVRAPWAYVECLRVCEITFDPDEEESGEPAEYDEDFVPAAP